MEGAEWLPILGPVMVLMAAFGGFVVLNVEVIYQCIKNAMERTGAKASEILKIKVEPERSKAWQNGWDDVMDGTVIVGSKEHREQLDDGKLPVVYTNRGGHITAAKRSSRNVSTYTTEEWNDYMDGRSAATDEKNRRDIVLRARVDQIDADNEKQARYLEALEELRSEYRQ